MAAGPVEVPLAGDCVDERRVLHGRLLRLRSSVASTLRERL